MFQLREFGTIPMFFVGFLQTIFLVEKDHWEEGRNPNSKSPEGDFQVEIDPAVMLDFKSMA